MSTSTNWAALEARLTDKLGLDRAPVTITFAAAAPTGVRKFMGQAPSSCSFWNLASEAPAGKSAFYTVPGDHWNCPIGAYTHRTDLPEERAHELTDVLGLMAQIGYVKMEEVPSIPRWPTAAAAIVYSRLGDAPGTPDAVIFALCPGAAMLFGEAARAAGVGSSLEPMPRPTCMAIPAAAAHGATMSLGCVGNRIYTGLPESHVYLIARGADVQKLADALDGIVKANAQLTSYHDERKARLSRIDA